MSRALCEACGRREAEVFLKQIVNNQVSQQALCRACAEKAGLAAGVPNLLIGLLAGLGGPAGPGARRPPRLQCPSCGALFGEFAQSGRLGCSDCYEALRAPLSDLLRRIHGAVRHAGKRPAEEARTRKGAETLEQLKKSLRSAIEREDFEEAAGLRDRIRRLDKEDGPR